jgi:hypothetical protein
LASRARYGLPPFRHLAGLAVSRVLFLAQHDDLDPLRPQPREQAVHRRETVGARALRDDHFQPRARSGSPRLLRDLVGGVRAKLGDTLHGPRLLARRGDDAGSYNRGKPVDWFSRGSRFAPIGRACPEQTQTGRSARK